MSNSSAPTWLPTSIPWVPCFTTEGALENVTWMCANLTVPVDYRDGSDNRTTIVGVAKARPNELTNPIGALFPNTGGPNGALILPTATPDSLLSTWLAVTGRLYEIIVVDPRGTGWSTAMTCGFDETTYANVSLAANAAINDLGNQGNLTNTTQLAQAAELVGTSGGPSCAIGENTDYLAHMNTPNVVRDMNLIRNLTGYDVFNYWGYSYGTVLGTMYAQMFPERVGRMIIDGVADYQKWTSNTTDLMDYAYASHSNIPNILVDFAAQCVEAAQQQPQYCYFGQGSLNASNPTNDLVQRMNYIVSNLTTKSYTDASNGTPFNLMALTAVIRDALAVPKKFPTLAQYFMDAEYMIQSKALQNNDNEYQIITTTISNVTDGADVPGNSTITTAYNPFDPFYGASNSFVWPAVVCLDMNVGNNTLDWFVDKWSAQVNKNALVGYMSKPFAACLGWPNLTNWDVERVHSVDFPKQLNNKMLVIGVTDDPVTPYHSALNTYGVIGANNSNFLVHKGFGHCSVSNRNNCTTAAITSYFVNGTLPANGTTCVSNNTGVENIFVRYASTSAITPTSSGPNVALALGLGLGLGIPFLLAVIGLFTWFLIRRRRRARQPSVDSAAASNMTEPKQLSVTEANAEAETS